MLDERVLKSVNDDLLNRSSVADTVRRRIEAHGSTRGLRIAIFGDWGSGKSSLAEWIVDGLPKDRWAIVRLAPWSCRSFDDFWNELAWGLLAAAKFHERRPGRGNVRHAIAEARAWLNHHVFRKTRQVEGEDTVGVFLRAAHQATALTEKDVEAILNSLEGCPVAVIIDDLDRMDPQVLPKALMTIRDGFADLSIVFLVPIDRGVAARAIEAYTTAWAGSGELFLEKIFDYRINVPEPSARERVDMLQSILVGLMGRERSPQVHVEIGKVLPPIPRRLKAIGRQIEMVSDLIENHHAFELDSSALILAATIKAESDEFYSGFVNLFASATLEAEATDVPIGVRASKKQIEEEFEKLGEAIFGADRNEGAARESHERAIGAARMLLTAREGAGFSPWARAVRILSIPPPITLKQLAWVQTDDFSDEGSLKRRLGVSYPPLVIARDMFAWAVIKLREYTHTRSRIPTTAADTDWIGLMSYALRADAFALAPETEGLRFAGYKSLMRWAVHPAFPQHLRERANDVLRRLCSATSGGSDWQRYSDFFFEDAGDPRRPALIDGSDDVFSALSNAAIEYILTELRSVGGGERVTADDAPGLVHAMLADPKSVLWRGRGVESGVARLLEGEDPVVTANLDVLRERLLSGNRQRWQRVGADAEVRDLLSAN